MNDNGSVYEPPQRAPPPPPLPSPPIHFPTQQSNTKSKRLISTLQHKLNTSTLPAFHLEPLFVRMVVEIRNGGEVGFGARGGGGMEIGKS